MNTLVDVLNRANPNTLWSALQQLGLGNILRSSLKVDLRMKTPSLDSRQLGTLHSFKLDRRALGSVILRAYARTSSGTPGELAIQAYGTTPASNQIAIAPNGDIVVLAADAISGLDVEYMPIKGDIIEITDLPVLSDEALIPIPWTTRGVVYLVEATATAGTATGSKIVLVPGTAPAAGRARLDAAKSKVYFANADAITKCTVKLLVGAEKDTDLLMQANSVLL